MAMMETLVGALAGAVLGSTGSWLVSRSERVKAEKAADQAAQRAKEDAETAKLAVDLARRLGSMLSPFTVDSITQVDLREMQSSWESYVQSLRLQGFNRDLSDVVESVTAYLDSLMEFRSGRAQRARVEQRREDAIWKARSLLGNPKREGSMKLAS